MTLLSGDSTTQQKNTGAAAAEAACFHCGLPVAAGRSWCAMVDGQRRMVCCPGCKAVAEAIAHAGLSSYYQARTACAASATQPGSHGDLRIYDRPEVQAGFVHSLGPDERETTLILEGITCAACMWLNERHLGGQPGVLSAEITMRRAAPTCAGTIRAFVYPQSSRKSNRSVIAPGRRLRPTRSKRAGAKRAPPCGNFSWPVSA